MLVLNAFSFNMVTGFPVTVDAEEISIEKVRRLLDEEGVESAVGHADTAAVFSEVIGMEVPMARKTVQLTYGDSAIVGQYSGPRLEEGSKELPEGASIKWLLISLAGI